MRTKNVIIHVGLHKTATTFLQEKIFPRVKNYTYLTRPYTQHNFAFNKLQYADDSYFKKEELTEELNKINAQNFLISDEALSGKPVSFGYINRTIIASRLAEIFPQAEIIVTLRGQQDILISHYNEWVKGNYSGYRNIDDFVWIPTKDYTYSEYKNNEAASIKTLFYNTNRFYLNFECFKYYELISLYKRLFNKVHVLLYEDFASNPHAVTQKLESILGENLQIPDNTFSGKVNASLKKDDLSLKIINNKVSILTKNRLLKKLLTIQQQLNNNTTIDPKLYINQKTKSLYIDNNKKLIERYTEIGIQNHPNKYRVTES